MSDQHKVGQLVAAGLATADEIKAIWGTIPAQQRPKDGETFSKLLIARDKLTAFQARELLSGSPTPLVLVSRTAKVSSGSGCKSLLMRIGTVRVVSSTPSVRVVALMPEKSEPSRAVPLIDSDADVPHFVLSERARGLELRHVSCRPDRRQHPLGTTLYRIPLAARGSRQGERLLVNLTTAPLQTPTGAQAVGSVSSGNSTTYRL